MLYQIAAKLKKTEEKKKEKQEMLGLRGANLTGVALDGLNLQDFDLTGIEFGHASLVARTSETQDSPGELRARLPQSTRTSLEHP